MNRIFVVYYEFNNTSGNHAGMAHLVKMIREDLPEVRLIKSVPHYFKLGKYIARIYAVLLAFYFFLVLKKGDKVFFFEYLTKGTAFQALTSMLMRALGITSPIYALIHLSGQHLMELYQNEKYLKESLFSVDKVFVFGSSLSTFLRSLGFQKEIITTFHYVDTDYYKALENKKDSQPLQVISIGGLKRDLPLLKNIISCMPEITFHILMGNMNLMPFFNEIENVQLHAYMSEEEMLHLMQICDICLSVMEDTIGSNAITTSMAVGLVQVVSDVGSIRDYCNESNSFLCREANDYVAAINMLDKDRTLLKKMKQQTLQKAATISHKAFIHQFKELVCLSH
jgi:glycosyltransferase involved in cell wall biosynthesis